MEIAFDPPKTKKKRRSSVDEIETLDLTHFSRPPRIDFGNVIVKCEKRRQLLLKNPHDQDQSVLIEKYPIKRNFSVSETVLMVNAKSHMFLDIVWKPEETGNYREMMTLLVDDVYRLQVIVYGSVVDPPKKRVIKRRVHSTRTATTGHQPPTVIQTPTLTGLRKAYSHKRRSSNETILSMGRGKVNNENQPPNVSVVQEEQSIQMLPSKTTQSIKTLPSTMTQGIETLPSKTTSTTTQKQPRRSMRRSITYSKMDKSNEFIDSGNNTPLKSIGNMITSKTPEELTSPRNRIPDKLIKSPSDMHVKSPDFYSKSPDILCTPLKNTSIMNTSVTNMSLSAIVFTPSPLQCSSPCMKSVYDKTDRGTDHVETLVTLPDAETVNVDKSHKIRRSNGQESVKSFQSDSLDSNHSITSIVSPNAFLPENKDKSFVEIPSNSESRDLLCDLNDQFTPAASVKTVSSLKTSISDDFPSFSSPVLQNNDVFDTFDDFDPSVNSTNVRPSPSKSVFSSKSDTSFGSCSRSAKRQGFQWKRCTKQQLFSEIPHTPSPRRTTFVVNKGSRLSPRSSVKKAGAKVLNRFKTAMSNRKITPLFDTGGGSKYKKQKPEQESFTPFSSEEHESFVPISSENTFTKTSVSSLEENPARLTMVIKPKDFDDVRKLIQPDNFRNNFGNNRTKSGQNIVSQSDMYRSKNCDSNKFPFDIESNRPDTRSIKSLTVTKEKTPPAPTFSKSPKELFSETEPPSQSSAVTFITSPDEVITNLHTPSDTFIQSPKKSLLKPINSAPLVKSPISRTHQSPDYTFTKSPVKSFQEKALIGMQTKSPINNSIKTQSPADTFVKSPAKSTKQTKSSGDIKSPPNTRSQTELRRIAKSPSATTMKTSNHVQSPADTFIKSPDKSLAQISSNSPADTFVKSPTKSSISSPHIVENSENIPPATHITKPSNTTMFISLDTPPNDDVFNVSSALATVRGLPSASRPPKTPKRDPTMFARVRKSWNTDARAAPKPAVAKMPPKSKSVSATVQVAEPKKDKKRSYNESSMRPRLRSSAKALPMQRLVLMRKEKTALPKHPMPFAAKNMYYDERWMEKQERGFVKWLNFVLTPPEDCASNTERVKVDIGKINLSTMTPNQGLAPTKEVLSLRAYSARRRLNQLRRSACRLFQSESVVRVIQKLEGQIEGGRLLVRRDKMLHADIGKRQGILDVILSYNSLWLRVGLETIFGELIPVQSNHDVLGMSRFVVTRLLSNPDISAKFAHPTVPQMYKPGYQEAINKHILKKYLMLVFFLDQAKSSRLIDHDPCLFCKDAQFKSSREYLVYFSKNFLSGEGDITKHLAYMGYVVAHSQTALDEFDYAVTSLAMDLRDGVRLTRVMEQLTSDHTLQKKIRAPAISRLQKVHNVTVAHKVLMDRGASLECKVEPRHIVDGDREKTLALLWSIIFSFQVECLIDETALRNEVAVLKATLSLKRRTHQLMTFSSLVDNRRESAESSQIYKSGLMLLLLQWCQTVCAFYDIKIENFTVSFGDGRALCYLLHHYYPAVMTRGDIIDDTMTSYQSHDASAGDDSFNSPWTEHIKTDEPAVFDQLLNNEKQNFKTLHEKVSDIGGVPHMLRSIDMSNTIPDEKVVVTYVAYLCARLLDIRHETRAAQVIQLAWRRRALRKLQAETTQKQSAAIVIQRQVCMYLQRVREQRRSHATLTIQRHTRGMLARKMVREERERRERAERERQERLEREERERKERLEKEEREEKERLRREAERRAEEERREMERIEEEKRREKERQELEKMERAAVIIQAHFRRHLAQSHYNKMVSSAKKIQRAARRWLRAKRAEREKQAATVIQQVYRKWKIAKEQKLEQEQKEKAVLVIQTAFRQYLGVMHERKVQAAITIQSTWRGYVKRMEYLWQKRTCVKIQACFRGHVRRVKFKAIKLAVIVIQRRYRAVKQGRVDQEEFMVKKRSVDVIRRIWFGYKARREVQRRENAAVVIQAMVHGRQQRKKFLSQKQSAVLLQTRYRAMKEMLRCKRQYEETKKAVVVLQSAWRGHQIRLEFQQQRSAAIVVQSHFRGYVQRKRFLRLKSACSVLQTRYRAKILGESQRLTYTTQRSSAILIQSVFRGYVQRKELARKHAAACIIQTTYRRFRASTKYRALKFAAVIFQRCFRNMLIGRQELQKFATIKESTNKIQGWWRKCQEKRKQNLINMTTKIQSSIRAYFAKRAVHQKYAAILVIQSQMRMLIARKRYLEMQQAALTLQARYRATKAMQELRSDFIRKKTAIVTLQSAFRMHHQRTSYKKQISLIVKLQSAARGMLERKRLLHLTAALVVIQSKWRLRQKDKLARIDYENKKQAVLLIQRNYRRFRQQLLYKKQVSLIIKLQSIVRGILERRRLVRLTAATVVIQSRWRSRQLAKQARCEHENKKLAALMIQRNYRMHQQRSLYNKQRFLIIKLQSAVRGMLEKRHLLRLSAAAVVIQSRWRSRQIMKQARFEYENKKRAALTIQRNYRMHQQRSLYRKQRSLIIILQSVVRGMLERRRLLRLTAATLVIQSRWRAGKMAKQARFEYENKKQAALIIQRNYRMHCQQSLYNKQTSLIIKLQSAVRGMLERKRLLRLTAATLIIQSKWRSRQNAKLVQTEYKNMKQSVIIIQRNYRRYLVQKIVKEHQCARAIQSNFRGFRQRKRYQLMRLSCLTIQANVRMSLCRKKFLSCKEAATTIQRGYRSCKIMSAQRDRYMKMKDSCVKIQRSYRLYKEMTTQREEYQTVRNSCVAIQRCYRAFVEKRTVKKNHAAVKIQTVYRGYVDRMLYKKQKSAAVVIQSCYRRHRQQKQLLKVKESTQIIQNCCRRLICKRERQKQLGVIVKTQALMRGKLARLRLQNRQEAAVRIQSYYRMHRERVSYRNTIESTVVIQTFFRSILLRRQARERYELHLLSVLLLQDFARMCLARKQIQKQKSAIVCIQRYTRGYLERCRYLKQREAIMKLQQRVRANITGLKCRREFLRMKNAAIQIQQTFRSYLIGQDCAREAAATLIQSTWRGHMIREIYLEIRTAVVKVQAWLRMENQRYRYKREVEKICLLQRGVRMWLLMRETRQRFVQMKGAAVAIQTAYRGYTASVTYRRDVANVVLVQAQVRGFIARCRFEHVKTACVVIQDWYRRQKLAERERTEFVRQKEACVAIQRAFQKWRVRRQQLCALLATKLQARWRMICERRRYQQMKQSAVTIQSVYRSYSARVAYKQRLSNIVLVQAEIRGFIQRRRFEKMKNACLKIEEWYASLMLARKERMEYINRKKACTKIQTAFREWRSRKQNATATKIQSVWRMIVAKRKYELQKCSAVRIQSQIRSWLHQRTYKNNRLKICRLQTRVHAWLLGKKCRAEYRETINAVVKIESWYKSVVQKQRFAAERRKIVVVQSVVRRRIAMIAYRKAVRERDAAVCIQKCVRGTRIRRIVQNYKAYQNNRIQSLVIQTRNHLAAATIQRSIRKHQALVRAQAQLHSVLVIQHWIRGRLTRIHYTRTRTAINTIQRYLKQWYRRRRDAACVIQVSVRTWLVAAREKRRHRAASIIRACWKGYQTRSSTIKRVSLMRKRIEVANQAATKENTLGSRTTMGIEYLLRHRNISYILQALQHLDVSTRLSPICCERLVSIDALPVIFNLMSSCNRSLPHMDLLKYAVNILLNLVKYEKTRPYVYHIKGAVSFLVDLMQIYRDKGVLFYKTCTLVGLLAGDFESRMELQADKKLMDRITSIYNLTTRKHKLDQKRKEVKTRINISMTTFNCTLPLTFPSQPMKVEPEWVLRRDSIHEIGDPLIAITFVVDSLRINPKSRGNSAASVSMIH